MADVTDLNPFKPVADSWVNGAKAAGSGNGGDPHSKKASPPPPQFMGSTGPETWQHAAEQQAGQGHVGLNGVVGSSGWKQDPATGQWTQTQGFNGPLAGAAQGYQDQIANQAPLDFGSLPQLDYGADAQKKATDAAYGQATSRLDPMFAQQEESQKAQLAAQGLDSPSMEANQNQWSNFNRAKTDAYGSAERYAVGQGLQAQQQTFQQSQQARQQALGEMLKQRGMPLEQLQGIMSLLGGAQGVGAAGAPNYLGALQAQGEFNLGGKDIQNKGAGQFWGNLGKAGGDAASLAMLLSDERAKHRIERLPIDVIPGVPFAIFEFRHSPGKHLGVIAQDVQKVRPEAVCERADGLLVVDYGGLGG